MLALLARADARIPLGAVRAGFSVRWAGRLEPSPVVRRLWWDSAHNVDGVRRLAQAWRDEMKMEPPGGDRVRRGATRTMRAMLQRLHAIAPDASLNAHAHAQQTRALPPGARAETAASRARRAVRDGTGVREALAPWLDHGADGRGARGRTRCCCDSLFAGGRGDGGVRRRARRRV